MLYYTFILILLSFSLFANECPDPLVKLLDQKRSQQINNLYNLLDQNELKKFEENDRLWHRAIMRLCKPNDCDCISLKYQQRNIELSQKLLKAKSEITTKIIQFTGEDTECGFSKPFPKNMVVYAAGASQGMRSDYCIGEKGENASVFRVIVNSPDRPVALILGSSDAAIWDISWTEGTKIEAAYVMGFHTQAVSGLPKTVPLSLIGSEKKSGCSRFAVVERTLIDINPLSNKLFHKNVASVYYAKKGYIFIGNTISDQKMLFTSADTPIQSLHRTDAPLQNEKALLDAVSKGILRSTTTVDLERWDSQLPRHKNLPTVATSNPEKNRLFVNNGFVILKPFVIPKGLYGEYSSTFFLEKGVPMPTGELGDSLLYDFNTMTCKGVLCNLNNFGY